MATPFQVALVTPERALFEGEAEEVSMRTEIGEIAFLAHHEDLVGASGVTAVRITTAGAGEADSDRAVVRAAIDGGTVHVHPEGLLIFAPVAELADHIDVERARRALERAEQRLASLGEGRQESAAGEGASADAEIAEAEFAARRARARLEAAGSELPA
ncbi:MAG: F0F1 ATP synthase subunit epsilon [Acidimicrobiales bacterium]